MVKELPYSAVVPLDETRRAFLTDAILKVLTPAQYKAAVELSLALTHGEAQPRPEEIMYWLRLNMPTYAARIDDLLHPND